MTTIDDLWKQICEIPDDDEPRLRFADEVEASDPVWASYIRMMIRRTAEFRGGESFVDTEQQPHLESGARWARNLLQFVQRGSVDNVHFDRGFPAGIRLHPAVFCEYADLILRLGPIRHVDFSHPYDDDDRPVLDEHGHLARFPLEEVLACPQLARLDSIGFIHTNVGNTGGALIAACPLLTRCLYLDFFYTDLYDESVIALAEGPLTGKMLGMRGDWLDHFSEYSEEGLDDLGEYKKYVFAEKGKKLEQRLGYIPWLHWANARSRYDLRWYFEHGHTPKVKPGTLPPSDDWYTVPPTRYRGREW
ncbi:MAG: hypothetical protein H0T79_24150 [Deltaproteobacteria bacterium]|nr:hypothetical protein [Deltaproteobacteria bacterium]